MPSFSFSSRFREGQWRAFRRFMLEERRDVAARVLAIEAELNRIGDVSIKYKKDPSGKVTEEREGIRVDPDDSSLAKLLQAYTALGGNPFDISMFLAPDRSVAMTEGAVPVATMPGGGVLHPEDIKYAYDQGVTDGDVNLLKYKDSRKGGKNYAPQEAKVLGIMQRAKKWIGPEIRYKRTRLEELIIKLMDLREQLETEMEDIMWAVYGELPASSQNYEPDRFNDSLTAGNIAYFFDSTFRVPSATEKGRVPLDDQAEEGQPGSVNSGVLGGYPSLMSDEDEEGNTAL